MDLTNYQKKFTIQKGGSERGELLERFLTHPIKVYQGKKLIPITISALAVELAHVKSSDLFAFYRECESAKSFGRFFWWALKNHPKWKRAKKEPSEIQPNA